MKNKGMVLLTLIAIMLFFTPTAYAYLDPGTGSVILQALAAGVLAIGVGWRLFMKRIKNFFRRDRSNK